MFGLPVVMRQEAISIALLGGGTLLAACLLARIYTRSAFGRVAMTLVFAPGLLVVYGGMAFVGCALASAFR
jgi:hypothetical protein